MITVRIRHKDCPKTGNARTTVVDDGPREKGPASAPFDYEGVRIKMPRVGGE